MCKVIFTSDDRKNSRKYMRCQLLKSKLFIDIEVFDGKDIYILSEEEVMARLL